MSLQSGLAALAKMSLKTQIAKVLRGVEAKRLKGTAERRREKFFDTHVSIGVIEHKNHRGQVVGKINVWRFEGWDYGKRWSGKDLREIRKRNGIGRPPRGKKEKYHAKAAA